MRKTRIAVAAAILVVALIGPRPSYGADQGQTGPAAGAPAKGQVTAPATPAVPQAPPAAAAPAAPKASATPGKSQVIDEAANIQMQFDNVEMRDLIKFISSIMGKNFIFDESTVKGKVTILSPKTLKKSEVFRVFENVLNYAGFSIIDSSEAFRIVKAPDAKGMAINKVDKLHLDSAPAEEKISTFVYPLEYLDASTMVGVIRPLMSKDAYLVSIASSNSLIMIDTQANLQRLKNIIADVDIPVSKQLNSIQIYNVQYTNAGDLAKVLQQLLTEGKKVTAPKDKIFVTAYGATNSLLISAPPEDMKEVRRIIDEIDTFRPQVLVEAAILEVSVSKGDVFGAEWLSGGKVAGQNVVGGVTQSASSGNSLLSLITGFITGGSTGATTIASSISSGLNVGIIGNSFTFNGTIYNTIGSFIRALASEDKVNIISTPQILTLNNEEAEILVGENRPYLTSTRIDATGSPINTYDYRDVGVKLKVKPVINKDGYVQLAINQEVQNIVVGTETSTGTTTPTTLKRSTKTTVGVKDAQTVVISGLIRDDSTDHREGIPGLSRIPYLGALFGMKKKEGQKTNLLVFITPRIIYTAGDLDVVTRDKRLEQEQLFQKKN